MSARSAAVALAVAVAVVTACGVQESTRSGGLVPPATTYAPQPEPVVKVDPAAAADEPIPNALADGEFAESFDESRDAPDAAGANVSHSAEQATASSVMVTLPAVGDTTANITANTAANITANTTTDVADVTDSDATSTADAASSGADSSAARVADTAATPVERDWVAEARKVLAEATPPEGFGEALLRVSGPRVGPDADPESYAVWPVIVADTASARQRGLMGVIDFPGLGGYAAMVFVFDSDTGGAFWMRDTPLRLRITFVAADGSVVSGTDMEPCLAPTPASECERYSAAGPYRFAIEHPADPEFDIGLRSAAQVELIG